MWPGLIDWIRDSMVQRGLCSSADVDVVKVVSSSEEAIPIIRASYEKFKATGEQADAEPARRPRRSEKS
jgi:predicted Rossmann-fold nucleotide-binding protein